MTKPAPFYEALFTREDMIDRREFIERARKYSYSWAEFQAYFEKHSVPALERVEIVSACITENDGLVYLAG